MQNSLQLAHNYASTWQILGVSKIEKSELISIKIAQITSNIRKLRTKIIYKNAIDKPNLTMYNALARHSFVAAASRQDAAEIA